MQSKQNESSSLMENPQESTFWELIGGSLAAAGGNARPFIIIPEMQRDYAQGREDGDTQAISKQLVSSLVDAVTTSSLVNFNLIYGEESADDVFSPIDGQQRLTTLFLLHWYVFMRTGDLASLHELRRFSYQTRDTTRRFCASITASAGKLLSIDFGVESGLSDQFLEFPWFTGELRRDPSIISMLWVLDEMHQRFRQVHPDFVRVSDRLRFEKPIRFTVMKMAPTANAPDLYIKVNARGKTLSEFENFKPILMKSEALRLHFPDEADAARYMGKFNTVFVEPFYNMAKTIAAMDGKTSVEQREYADRKHDRLLMMFLRDVLGDAGLLEPAPISRARRTRQTVRKEYAGVRSLGPVALGRWMNLPDVLESVSSGLLAADVILHQLCGSESSWKQDLINRLTRLYRKDIEARESSEDVRRFGLFEFLRMAGTMGGVQEDAYKEWVGFVDRLVANVDFSESADTAIAAMESIRQAMRRVNEQLVGDWGDQELMISSAPVTAGATLNRRAILEGIASLGRGRYPRSVRAQLLEEAAKATLLLSGEREWHRSLAEAQEYFPLAQIGFLLLYANTGQRDFPERGILEPSFYDVHAFRQYFQAATKLLAADLSFSGETVPSYELEQALLQHSDVQGKAMNEFQLWHMLPTKGSSRTVKLATGHEKEFFGNRWNEFSGEEMSTGQLAFKKILDTFIESGEVTTGIEEHAEDDDALSQNGDSKERWKRGMLRTWKNQGAETGVPHLMEKLCSPDTNRTLYISPDENTLLLLKKSTAGSRSSDVDVLLLKYELNSRFTQDIDNGSIYIADHNYEATRSLTEGDKRPLRRLEITVSAKGRTIVFEVGHVHAPLLSDEADETSDVEDAVYIIGEQKSGDNWVELGRGSMNWVMEYVRSALEKLQAYKRARKSK